MLNALTDDGGVMIPTYTFEQVTKAMRPFFVARSFSGVMLTLGHLAFTISVFWIILRPSKNESAAPTLLTSDAS
jgi:cbb3-type cytochrome oxidase subunit 1